MRVDEAGHDDTAVTIDRVGGGVRVGLRTDRHDGVSRDRDGTTAVNGEPFVHRQNGRVGQTEVAGRHASVRLYSVACGARCDRDQVVLTYAVVQNARRGRVTCGKRPVTEGKWMPELLRRILSASSTRSDAA